MKKERQPQNGDRVEIISIGTTICCIFNEFINNVISVTMNGKQFYIPLQLVESIKIIDKK
jgi:hypothetical protein